MKLPKSYIIYPERKDLYLKDSAGDVHKFSATGETSKSWMWGPYWKPMDSSRAKSKYSVVTEEEFREYAWASKHKYFIAQDIQRKHLSASVLRQIAEMIGYEEASH